MKKSKKTNEKETPENRKWQKEIIEEGEGMKNKEKMIYSHPGKERTIFLLKEKKNIERESEKEKEREGKHRMWCYCLDPFVHVFVFFWLTFLSSFVDLDGCLPVCLSV